MVKLIKGENDLATLCPSLVQEWHPTENGDLKPEDVSSGSSKEVWWLCPKGHPYQMVINQRIEFAYTQLVDGKSIEESASESGFEDYFYFIKAFKKHWGITPGELRKKYFPSPNGNRLP